MTAEARHRYVRASLAWQKALSLVPPPGDGMPLPKPMPEVLVSARLCGQLVGDEDEEEGDGFGNGGGGDSGSKAGSRSSVRKRSEGGKEGSVKRPRISEHRDSPTCSGIAASNGVGCVGGAGIYPWYTTTRHMAEDVELELRSVYGDDAKFKSPARRSAVVAALSRSTDSVRLVCLRTGGGKSMCFILPARVETRHALAIGTHPARLPLTIVLTSTKALSTSIINACRKCSVHAEGWSPSNGLGVLHNGAQVLVADVSCVASDAYQQLLASAASDGRLSRIVIDEIHQLPMWRTFRECNDQVQFRLRARAPRTPILLLTATAPPDWVPFLRKYLGAGDLIPWAVNRETSTRRPDLGYVFEECGPGRTDDEVRALCKEAAARVRTELLVRSAERRAPGVLVVFCQERSVVDMIHADLDEAGQGRDRVGVIKYHAKLPESEKEDALDRLLSFTNKKEEESLAFIASPAASTGVDYPSISWALHVGGRSLVDFQQAAGWVGRSGEGGVCTLWNPTGYDERLRRNEKSSKIVPGSRLLGAFSEWLSRGECRRLGLESVMDFGASVGATAPKPTAQQCKGDDRLCDICTARQAAPPQVSRTRRVRSEPETVRSGKSNTLQCSQVTDDEDVEQPQAPGEEGAPTETPATRAHAALDLARKAVRAMAEHTDPPCEPCLASSGRESSKYRSHTAQCFGNACCKCTKDRRRRSAGMIGGGAGGNGASSKDTVCCRHTSSRLCAGWAHQDLGVSAPSGVCFGCGLSGTIDVDGEPVVLHERNEWGGQRCPWSLVAKIVLIQCRIVRTSSAHTGEPFSARLSASIRHGVGGWDLRAVMAPTFQLPPDSVFEDPTNRRVVRWLMNHSGTLPVVVHLAPALAKGLGFTW